MKITTDFNCALNLVKTLKYTNEIINYIVDYDVYGNRTIFTETNQGFSSIWRDTDYNEF